MMITIVAKCTIKEEKVQEFIELTKELITESRKEEGCISYDLHQDISNKSILTFIEEWKDKKSIELHNATEHFTTIVPKLGALQEKQTEVNLYEKF